jgi:hypothetical protein
MMAVHVTIEHHRLTLIRTVTFHDAACSYNHHVDNPAALMDHRDELAEMMDRWHCMGCKACRARIVEP